MPDTSAQIGPYTVLRELGRGGMGVVFLAHDAKLDRDVAIKALPAHLAQDADRLARFQREAKVLASLNHSGIAAIFGLEDVAGTRYLVLEFVDGESLADRLARGPIAVDEALALAKQIAEALEAAHEKGVVHRDVKPGNVMVNAEGKVKVLDFGLARAGDAAPSTTGVGTSPDSPTLTTPPRAVNSPTIPGAIMGTAGYMSPEQARGKAVDKRSDIFSFGCVLYEMLSGRQPFGGETVADSLGATLHKDLDPAHLPAATPARVRDLLTSCLAKDRHQRLHDIADARLALERAISGREWLEGARVRRAGRAAGLPMMVTGLLLGGAAVLGAAWALWPRAVSGVKAERPVFAVVEPLAGSTISVVGDLAGPAVVSPDGSRIAFGAKDKGGRQVLCVRALDAAEPEELRGTDGATFPFWSPEGHAIGFFAEGKLRRIDLTTRAVRTLCDAPGARGGAWLESGDIVFTPAFQAALFRVPAAGGEARAITTVDAARFSSHRWPSVVRGTDRIVYLAVNHDPTKGEEASLFITSLDGRFNQELVPSRFSAQVVGGRLLFLRESTLLAVRLDAATGTLNGEPVGVLQDVYGDRSTWRSGFSAAENGAMVYHVVPPSEAAADNAKARNDAKAEGAQVEAGLGESTRATVLTPSGAAATVADGMLQNSLSASPDGLKLAVSGRWPNETGVASYDIWVFHLFGPGSDFAKSKFEPVPVGTKPLRFTFMPGAEVSPEWSPDGKMIAFAKIYGPEPLGLFVKPLDGGPERLLAEVPPGPIKLFPTGWSPDGRYVIAKRGPYIAGSGGPIEAVPVSGGPPTTLVDVGGAGSVSPDGKWLAFDMPVTSTTPDPPVFVAPYALGWEAERAAGKPVPDPGQRYRVSIAGGYLPRWGRSGKTLNYVSSSNSIIAVNWHTEGVRFVFDAGQAIIDYPAWPGVAYDVLPSDLVYVVNADLTPREVKLRLVLNWTALLKR